MKTVIDVEKTLAGMEAGCADIRKAFKAVEDELCGAGVDSRIILIRRDESEVHSVEKKECSLDVLLADMPEILPEHKSVLREAFMVIEDERSMAHARAKNAEDRPWMMRGTFDSMTKDDQRLFRRDGGKIIEF